MKLRTFSIVTIAITISFFILFQTLISNFVVNTGFQNLEDKQTRLLVKAAKRALYLKLTNLDKLLLDWASWDDTYAFVQDHDQEYVQSNLPADTFLTQSLACVAIQNRQGEPVYLQAFNEEEEFDADLAKSIFQQVSGELPPLTEESDVSGGVIALDDGTLVLVVKRPILTSNATGPSMGSFMMSRLITKDVTEEISTLLGANVSIVQLENSKIIYEDIIDSEDAIYVSSDADNISDGYGLVFDIHDEPVAFLKVEADRFFSHEGKKISNYYLVAIAVAILLLGILVYTLLHKKILNRLDVLMRQVSQRENAQNTNYSIVIEGNDEIHDLSVCINTLVHKIEHAKHDVEQKTEEVSSLTNPAFCKVGFVFMNRFLFRPLPAGMLARSAPIERDRETEVESTGIWAANICMTAPKGPAARPFSSCFDMWRKAGFEPGP